jgi:hypothetical protein
MVGRALDGEIERDLQAVLRAAGDQASEVVEVPSSGCKASWPPASEPIA